MGLKRLWRRIFGKTKKPPPALVDPSTHSTEHSETTVSDHSLPGDDAVKLKATDEGNIAVNKPSPLQKINELPQLPFSNLNDTVVLQVGQHPMPVGMPLQNFHNTSIEDAGTAVVSRNGNDLCETPPVSAPALQPILPDQQAVTPSIQCPSPPSETSNPWLKIFALNNLTRRARHHHGLMSENVDSILASNGQQRPSRRHNHRLLVPTNEKEAAEDSLHRPHSLSFGQTYEGFLDTPNCRKDGPRMTRMDEAQMNHKFYKTKALPEIPKQISEEIVGEVGPEEVILYPRKDEFEALRRQYPSSPPVEANTEAQNLLEKFPEMVHRPLVGLLRRPPSIQNTPDLLEGPPTVITRPLGLGLTGRGVPQKPLDGLLRRLPAAPISPDLSSDFPSDLIDTIEGPPTVIARPLILARRSAPKKLPVNFLHRHQAAPSAPDLSSDFSPLFLKYPHKEDPSAVIRARPLELARRGDPLSAPPGLESSLRDSLFSSLDMYSSDGSLEHTSQHPWNTQFIGKGASGKVFRVGYNPKTWIPIPGMPPITLDKESKVASVKVIDMKKQTEGSLEGLISEVIALKVLNKKRDDVADAKAKGKCMRLSDGLHCLLESASLPGVGDTAFLREGRLYLLTKYYNCDLTSYCCKVSNNEKSLAFILSELAQGLNYLHHIGMVHLDLKPSNVFITHDRHCVIGDLGSSIHEPGSIMTNEIGLLVDMVTSFTDGFCAPEIIHTRSNLDRFNCKADFWSLGVTMYNVVRPDGLSFPKTGGDGFEDHFGRPRDYDDIGLAPKHMAKVMYEVGCPGRIVNLVLNLCQRDPKKRLGGRGIIKNLKSHGLFCSPFDLSPLPDVRIPPCGPPGPDSEGPGPYYKLNMRDACKVLKGDIECKGYNLTMH